MLLVESATILKNKTWLLQDIHFELRSGDILFVVGPNGAGKTTLVKTLMGEVPLSSGNILLNGEPLHNLPTDIRAKHVAVLPQVSTLSFPYSVTQVVSLGRIPHSSGLEADKQIVNDALNALDINHLKDRIYTELSGGEKQRTQLARVFAQIWGEVDAKSRLLILDEPTSSLDIGHKQQLMKAIRAFSENGVAVLVVEHDLNVALRYASSILVLHQGKVAAYGAPEKAITEDILGKVFNADVDLLKSSSSGKTVVGV